MTIFYRIGRITRLNGILSLALGVTFLMSACSGLKTTPAETTEEPISVITGEPGGIKLFGNTDETNAKVNMPVNALLWRAALDIASFVPLDDVDTFGGSIITRMAPICG